MGATLEVGLEYNRFRFERRGVQVCDGGSVGPSDLRLIVRCTTRVAAGASNFQASSRTAQASVTAGKMEEGGPSARDGKSGNLTNFNLTPVVSRRRTFRFQIALRHRNVT